MFENYNAAGDLFKVQIKTKSVSYFSHTGCLLNNKISMIIKFSVFGFLKNVGTYLAHESVFVIRTQPVTFVEIHKGEGKNRICFI
jgi:hypothetical protein